MNNFTQLRTTKKGDFGEDIVRELLIKWGFTIYPAPDESHPVDFLVWKDGEFTAIDVKTYPRLFSKDCTGIDKADFVMYQRITTAHKMPVKLFFVDQFERKVYGHRLDYLARFKKQSGTKVLFPLSAMIEAKTLTDEEVSRLTELSSINYSQYEHLPRYFSKNQQ